MTSKTSFSLHPLLETLIYTWSVMLSGGIGFGLALRNSPTDAISELETPPPVESGSSSLLQSEQTFPPRPGWNIEEEEDDSWLQDDPLDHQSEQF